MKHKIIFLVGFICMAMIAYAQVPQSIPYQAVARDNFGNLITNQNISLRFTIHDVSTGGTIVYRETQAITTNGLGLFSVNVGQGTVITGTFSSIVWKTNAKFLQVEMDATGGSSYIDMGTQQMLSVPYALHSLSSSDAWKINGNEGTNPSTNFIGTIDGQPLIFKVSSNNAGIIDIANSNTGLGYHALNVNTTGYHNTSIGYGSLNSNTTGYHNTAIGGSSLNSNVNGLENSALGQEALLNNISGNQNTASGGSALSGNTLGSNNTANGRAALFKNNSGNDNTAMGLNALYSNTTGTGNVAIGNNAGYTTNIANANTTGSNNTFIGYNAGPGTSTQYTNATSIGYSAIVSASNSLVLGGTGANAVNVGIGTSTPAQELDVVGDINSSLGYRIANGATSGRYLRGNGTRFVSSIIQLADVPNLSSLYVDLTTNQTAGGIKTWSNNAIFNGDIGIGVASPLVSLDVRGSNLKATTASFENIFQAASTDASPLALRIGIKTDATAANRYVAIEADDAGTKRNLVLQPTSGFVGIRTTNPIYPLEVNGTVSTGSWDGWLYGSMGDASFNGFSSISIHAQGVILATALHAFSDSRIKNVINRSDPENDLALLNKIEVVNYKYIDKVNMGNGIHKKVIAQQLETILPEAVSKSINFIPNIYAIATSIQIENGIMRIALDKPHEMNTGDKIKWIDDTGAEHQDEVQKIISENIFEIRYAGNTQKAFVYGKQVNDFRTVDYEAISMLNVSASQELYKLMLELQDENEKLKSEIGSFRSDLEKIKTQMVGDVKAER